MFSRQTKRVRRADCKSVRKIGAAVRAALVEPLETRRLLTASWTAVATAPVGVKAMSLLSNGDVIAQDGEGTDWEILTPSSTGSYINGTWSRISNAHDTRVFYSSQILTNGNLFVAGGEDGNGGYKSEVYNPLTNTWTETPQANAGAFLDSNSEILANGDVMIPPVYTTTYGGTVLYNPATNSWSSGPTLYRGDDADEQTWIKLADGSILTIDGLSATADATSERYIPSTNTWVNDAAVPEIMSDDEGEMGPAALLPNGKVFFTGANGNTVIYTPSGYNASEGIYVPNGSTPGSWAVGPTIPGGLGEDDAPCTILPDGNVLIASSPYDDNYSGPSSFFLYNASTNTISALSATNTPTETGGADGLRFLDLPDGTVLLSTGSTTVYDFNPGDAALTAPDPAITSIVHNSDGSYTLNGTQLNGPSEGAIYGDDAQMNTNYPIVRLNNSGGAYFARTYNWSSTGVDTGPLPESTNFALPQGLPAGTYTVNVMVNGYISAGASITTPYVSDSAPTITSVSSSPSGPVTGASTTLSAIVTGGTGPLTYTWVNTSAPSGSSTASFSANANSSASSTIATFQQKGTYTFTVTVTDVDGLSATGTVTVTVNQTATSIAITPGPADLSADQTQQLSAEEYDQFGNAMSSQPGSYTWAETSGGGSINSSSGLYTSPGTGTQAAVTATANSITGSTTMNVVDSPWIQADINSPPVTGTGFDTGGTFNISGSGDRSYTTEQGHFVYRSLGGNGTIIANVSSQSMSTSTDAEAGLMISQSTAAGAEEVFLALSPASGVFMQDRTSLNADYGYTTAVAGIAAPCFLKLVRNGNTFTGYYSTNGTSWTLQGTETVVMSGPVDMGMFLFGGTNSSNGTTVPSTATFTNLSVIAAAGYTVSVQPGASTSLNLLTGDTGPSGATLSITGVTQGSKGSVTLNASGGATYTANTTAVGTDTFTYTMSDGLGDTATGTVTVNILGIIAYYKMNEGTGATTADATGDGYTGTITGATWTTGGVAGDGLTFNGNGEYVTLPAMNLSTNTLTFSGWVDSAGTQTGAAGIIFNRESPNGNGLDMYNGSDLGYTWGTNASTYNFNSGLALPTGTWTFVALVITPNNATFYMKPLGGSLSSATQTISLPVEPFDQSILIGEDTNSASRCFNGSMDEVRIYNTNLSSAAISALAQTSSFLTAVPQSITAYYGAPGTVNVLAQDSGPNGSTLSVTNFNQPSYGVVTYNASTGFTYSPSTLNSGTDSFTYTLADGLGDTTTGLVNVTIQGNIACYNFNEGTGTTTLDATGDGYTGTVSNTAWATGLTGLSGDDALSFNGTSSSVTFSPSPSLSGTGNFSAGAWIKTTSTAGEAIIQQRDPNGFNGEYQLAVNTNGTVSFYIYYNGYQFDITSTTTVNNGAWHQITAVRNGSSGFIYIDGVQAATGSGTIAALSGSITVEVGANLRDSDDYFNGLIDNVFISDVALTASGLATVSKLGPVVSTAAAASPTTVTGNTTALSALGGDYYESSFPLTYTWAATTIPSGATAPTYTANSNSSAASTTARFYKAGNYVFTVTIKDQSNLTTTSTIGVTVNQTATAIVDTPTSVSLASHGSQTFSAVENDQFGIAMSSQPTFVWSSTGTGSINSSTGAYTAGYATGTATVTATAGSINQSAAVTVTDAAPVITVGAAASPSPVTANTATLSVTATDDAGAGNLTYTWTTTGTPPASVGFSANANASANSTVATFTKAGTYNFQVTVTDLGGMSNTSSVTLIVNQTLTTVSLSSTNVVAGQTSQATAFDQFGNSLTPAWTVTGGSINTAGLFTAGSTGGSFQVTGTFNSIAASAGVTVVPTSYAGTTGNDTYAIRVSPTNNTLEQIFVNTPETGSPTYTAPLSQISKFTFTPASDSSLTVDFANGNPLPANGINFSGGGSLVIAGASAGGMSFTVNGSQVVDTAAAASPIAYSGLQTIALNLSGGSNTLTQLAQPGAAVTYNAGPLSNTLNVSGGTFTFNADPQTSSGSLTLNDNAGVVFSGDSGAAYNPRNLYALNLGTNATATLASSNSTTGRTVLETNILALGTNATLDLTNNAAIIHGGNILNLTNLVATGFNAIGGYWNGTGITSSAAATDPTHLGALGIIANNLSGATLNSTFDNQSASLNDVLIKYTYYGDATLDGKVDGTDYSRIDSAHQTPATGWFNGDFNYDNDIDGSDYTLIDNAFNTQGAKMLTQLAAPASQIATTARAVVNRSRITPVGARPTSMFQTQAPISLPGATRQNEEELLQKKDVLDVLSQVSGSIR